MDFAVWVRLYKKEIWDGLRFPERRNYEDFAVMYKVLQKAKYVAYLDEILYKYRNRSGSITATKSIKNMHDFLLSTQEFDSFVNENTPEIFTEEARNAKLIMSIVLLSDLSFSQVSKHKTQEGLALRKEIKKEILKKFREIHFTPGRLNFLIKHFAALILIRYCPWLHPFVRSCYRTIKKFVTFFL